MFKQRMQALILQDRKQLRRIFEEFDKSRTGQLSLDQFFAALKQLAPELPISRSVAAELIRRHAPLVVLGANQKILADSLVFRFSVEPGYILFQDFVINFLGLPEVQY